MFLPNVQISYRNLNIHRVLEIKAACKVIKNIL